MSWTLKCAGFNHNKLDKIEEVKIAEFGEVTHLRSTKEFLINSTAFYEIIVYNELKIIDVKSSILDINNIIKFTCSITQVLCYEENSYFLHEHNRLSQYNVKTKEYSFLNIQIDGEKITQLAVTAQNLFGMSDRNRLYEILPNVSLIHEFKTFQKIKKMKSGLEHVVLMTSGGDVFTFGCSLRGQCGAGTMNPNQEVQLCEALAGIKIIDIACNAFGTVCVSSFGDVYSFGWNTNGQLGGVKKTNNRAKQVYSLPELIESVQETIVEVACGHKHTVLRTENNKLLVTGLNNYGQLGISDDSLELDTFKEMAVDGVNSKTKICCGYWNSYLINFKAI